MTKDPDCRTYTVGNGNRDAKYFLSLTD